jgi:hypothetical protein
MASIGAIYAKATCCRVGKQHRRSPLGGLLETISGLGKRMLVLSRRAQGLMSKKCLGRLPTIFYNYKAFTRFCKFAQSFLSHFSALDDPPSNPPANLVILTVRPSLTNPFQCDGHISECSSIEPVFDHGQTSPNQIVNRLIIPLSLGSDNSSSL